MIPYKEGMAGVWHVLTREGLEAEVATALDSPGRVLRHAGGRGAITLHSVCLPPEHLTSLLPELVELVMPPELVVRRCRRGGFVRHFLREGYLFGNRPVAEFMVHGYLESQGIPVPPLAGVAWRRQGMVLHGRVMTLRILGKPLHDCLLDAGGNCLAEVGRQIRRMHDVNVEHPDLNVHNVLVHDGRVYLLDFDKCRRYSSLSDRQRAKDLARFRRSLEKRGHSLGYFALLLEGYGPSNLPAWLKV